MRIRKLWLDGYGRFSGRELALEPGLQVLLGPNEQGKSTTRSFVGDMLYGQKRSGSANMYDENHELRRPWHDPETYGGRIAYELDSGRRFEVHRSFAAGNEWVRILEGDHGHEVTGDFERLQNRELNFADRHLGLSKEVFLSAATLSHLTLEGLGDSDALEQIRERILSLADSGDEAGSAKAAVERLQARIARIGRPDLPKRPLPAARNRLHDLQKEYEDAFQHLARINELEARRRRALAEEARLREQRTALEHELQARLLRDDATRLREVESLEVQITALTQRCFELASARNFPLDALPEVQRLEMQLSTARAQHRRTQESIEALRSQLGDPSAVLKSGVMAAIPEDLEDRLADVEARIKNVQARRRDIETDREAAQARLEELQKALGAMPDFSRVASDPVDWLTQLGTSFTMARRVFEEETSKLQLCETALRDATSELRPLAPLFESIEDFPGAVEAYQERQRQLQTVEQEAARRAEEHRFHAEEFEAAAPTNRLMAFLAAMFMIVLAVAPSYTGNQGTYIPAVLSGIGFLYFLVHLLSGRRAARRARALADEAEQEAARIREENAESHAQIEDLLERGGCQTVRELEALYDTYAEAHRARDAAEAACASQRTTVDEARAHVEGLFEKLVSTFQQVGERPQGYDDVAECVGRAIGRYQEYRDTKRRIADARDRVNQFDQHFKRLAEELDAARREEDEVSRELRRFMRANGYDEAKHDSTSGAVRAYKILAAESREERARTGVLAQQLEQLEQELAREAAEEDGVEREIQGMLDAAGVDSLEMWHEMAGVAREYHEARTQLTTMEERMASLLRGTTREALHEAAAAIADHPAGAPRSAEELRQEIAAISDSVESLQNEAHDLHVMIAEQSGGIRPLYQIEEERSALMRQIQELELEVQAASYAIALIQEAAQDKHAHIAPPLAELASTYLGEITGGRYSEVAIDRDFNIHVRIPQREALDSEVERRLSKGTVDQIYLALRLAMVQMLSRNGESIPMILDDPFANYDDERLSRTMALLVRIAQHNQILLFTCREDVATVGRSLDVPVLSL